jgi:hypothetical protein
LEPWISDGAAHRTRRYLRSKPEVFPRWRAADGKTFANGARSRKSRQNANAARLHLRPDLGAIGEENVDAQTQRGVVLNVFAVLLAIAVVQLGARWKVAIATAFVIAAAGSAYASTPPARHTTRNVGPSEQVQGSAAVPAVVPFARYVAAFNSESSANQIALGNARSAAHVSRAVALKSALRQEAGAVVLGSGRGTFRSAPYHYKPFAVWVFALDPRGPHNQRDEGPPGNHANLEYNYDVVIDRGSSGVVIEEAMGWDKGLQVLPPVRTAHK